MNWTDQAVHKSETYQKISNIDKVKIFCVLHDKVALLTRRCSEWGATDCHQIIFRTVLTITYRKCWSKDEFFNGSDETDIRLPFHRSFSTFWNIFGGSLHSLVGFLLMGMGKRWCKVICAVKWAIPEKNNRKMLRT